MEKEKDIEKEVEKVKKVLEQLGISEVKCDKVDKVEVKIDNIKDAERLLEVLKQLLNDKNSRFVDAAVIIEKDEE